MSSSEEIRDVVLCRRRTRVAHLQQPVYSVKDAEAAVRTLLEQGVPADQVSIVGQDLRSETQVHGFVTTGEVAKTGAKTGAWVIAKKHVPKYTRHLEAGNYLVLRHQPQASDAELLQQDTTPVEVEHHEDLVTATGAGAH